MVAQDPISAYDRIDFSRLSVVVGPLAGRDGDEIERHLGILGIGHPKIVKDYERVGRSVDAEKADLLLCDMTIGTDQAQSVMRGIRNQEVANNPFIVMISLVERMTKEGTAQAIDTGTDDLFLSPFSRDLFVRRVNDLAWNRRKFVAVSSYIGPTRRSGTRPGRKTADEFDVPNPVQSSGTGVAKDVLWKEIAAAAKSLSVRKLNADVAMIRNLVDEIVPDYEASNITEDFKRRIAMLQASVGSVYRRAGPQGYENLVSLCEIAGNVITEIKERPVPPNLRHLKAMPKMVEGFEAALLIVPGREAFN